MSTFDAIVIGAGSVGAPTAYFLAQAGLSVGVFDPLASAGRGDNRAAIGGIRATHSDRAKVALGLEALEIFSSWQQTTGDEIGWRQGGYTFVSYTDATTAMLSSLVTQQRAVGLDIDFVPPERVLELVPGLVSEGLQGGTFSPGDGSASPLQCASSFRAQAEKNGARFFFKEPVVEILTGGGRVEGVVTAKGRYSAPVVIVAAGAHATAVAHTAGVVVPIAPDCHEAGITEPVARFMEPMVVDIRPSQGSKNFYFYQNLEGQVVFCITPDPPVVGVDRRSTSVFLPLVAKRMVGLLPRLANLKIRRVWRGLYPMTPDGSPFVGPAPGVEGLVLAAGMCGQGYMLGPAIGAVLTRHITGDTRETDRQILEDLRLDRGSHGKEALA